MDNSSLNPIKCFQFGPWKKKECKYGMESHWVLFLSFLKSRLPSKNYCFSNEILHQNSSKLNKNIQNIHKSKNCTYIDFTLYELEFYRQNF